MIDWFLPNKFKFTLIFNHLLKKLVTLLLYHLTYVCRVRVPFSKPAWKQDLTPYKWKMIFYLHCAVSVLVKIRADLINTQFPANIYLFQVNNRNTRKRYEICSKLTIKTPERRQWRRSGVFIFKFEHISQFFPVFPLLT